MLFLLSLPFLSVFAEQLISGPSKFCTYMESIF